MIVIMSVLHALINQLELGKLVLQPGQALFQLGDSVSRMHVVISGEVVLERHSTSGMRLVLQRARTGDIIAEPSVFAESYHCSASAITAVTIAFASAAAIRSALTQDGTAMERLARSFAREVQIARFRVEILSIRRLSNRLDAWLDLNGGVLPEKGRWLSLAGDLAVAPEALYRELAKRRNIHTSRGESALRA